MANDKIINPKTNRFVSVNGLIGKKIMASITKRQALKMTHYESVDDCDTLDEFILFAKTHSGTSMPELFHWAVVERECCDMFEFVKIVVAFKIMKVDHVDTWWSENTKTRSRGHCYCMRQSTGTSTS